MNSIEKRLVMKERIITKNLVEELVDSQLDKIIKESDVCQCDYCKADIRAIALNQLPPHYVVTSEGALHVKADTFFSSQAQTDIVVAISQGISVVAQKPRHDCLDKE